MHVLQSQLVNYSYENHSQKNIKLVRWWIMGNDAESLAGHEITLLFTEEQENIFIKFMDDHHAIFQMIKERYLICKTLPCPHSTSF